ncbi:hypothetical protein BDZ45DRAFT_746202 [Acephala macrosclerotiorum]|nr:hypothetical protein BDZ45DRAFT_746202 [Acephala macrosclerotiorum]
MSTKSKAIAKAVHEFETWTYDTKRRKVKLLRPLIRPDRGVEPVARLCAEFIATLHIENQTTNLLLQSQSNWQAVLYGDMFKFAPSDDKDIDTVFTCGELGVNGLAINKINNMLTTKHLHDAISDDMLKAMEEFGKNEHAPNQAGLHFMTFQLKTGKKVRATYVGEGVPVKDPMVEAFVKELNDEKTRMTMQHRIRVMADKGLYPFYTDIVDTAIGRQFSKWVLDPNLKLKHQPWMGLKGSKNKEFQKSVSHEIAFENQCVRKYYDLGIKHKAKVIDVQGRCIELEIQIDQVEDVVQPSFSTTYNTENGTRLGSIYSSSIGACSSSNLARSHAI